MRLTGLNHTASTPFRVALIGWGAIGRATSRLVANEPVEIVAVGVRDATADRPDLPSTAQLLNDPSELAGVGADLVIEVAGRDSVAPWGRASLSAGIDFVVASVSAFADQALLDELVDLASANQAKLHLTPGAIGGVDALAASRSMGLTHVEHRMVKPPIAWRDTPAETLCDLAGLTDAHAFFQGSADQAASAFPKNANVAMTTALAGLGPTNTKVTLIADPAADGNRHEIIASGDFGEFTVVMRNNALPENPKSSAMTALSLCRLIQNHIHPLVI